MERGKFYLKLSMKQLAFVSGQLNNLELAVDLAKRAFSAFSGSAVEWPFSNKTTVMQQYMSFKAAQEERQKNFAVEQFSSSGFQPMLAMDAFETSHGAPTAMLSQVHGAQNSPNNITLSPLNQLPYGGNMSASGAGHATGTFIFPPRNMHNRTPTAAQMTIFYDGTVNVYDDVPFEKVHAIMLHASKGSNSG